MPRPASATSPNGLPLWDTFEVSFFLIAGVFVGLVLGFLLPSIWRTLRRRFRNTKRFEAKELALSSKILPSIQILEDNAPQEVADLDSQISPPTLKIAQAFVWARSLIQEGNHREAVRVYIDILSFEQVTKKQTNRALFELAQAYDALGLSSRAFDTAWELLHRKPDNEGALRLLLQICEKFSIFEKVKNIILLYNGNAKPELRLLMAHVLCAAGEKSLQNKQIEKTLEMARDACRMSLLSARARLLLWVTSSMQAWQNPDLTVQSKLTLLAADLEARWQIYKDTKVSPQANAFYLSEVFENVFLALEDEPLEIVTGSVDEFKRIAGLASDAVDDKNYEWIALLALKNIPNISRYLQHDANRELIKIILSSFYEKLLVNQSLPLYERLTSVGLAVHRCFACGAVEVDMPWVCLRCEARESYQPFLSLTH